MKYTILSAAYANPDHTALIVETREAGAVLASIEDTPGLWWTVLDLGEPAPYAPLVPVPAFVSNFQARAVMRQTFLPQHEGKSLFTVVNDALKAQIAAAADLPESDPDRIAADVAWQAWEQANNYERSGQMMMTLGSGFGVPPEQIDELFRQADKVAA